MLPKVPTAYYSDNALRAIGKSATDTSGRAVVAERCQERVLIFFVIRGQ